MHGRDATRPLSLTHRLVDRDDGVGVVMIPGHEDEAGGVPTATETGVAGGSGPQHQVRAYHLVLLTIHKRLCFCERIELVLGSSKPTRAQ